MAFIEYATVNHRGENWILVKFNYNPKLNMQMTQVVGAKWSNTKKAWLVPDTAENRKKCRLEKELAMDLKKIQTHTTTNGEKNNKKAVKTEPTPPIIPEKNAIEISENNKVQMQMLLQQLTLKAYSQNTIKTYRNEFAIFLQAIQNHPAQSISVQKIKDYLQYCFDKLKLTENTLHSRINTLKFYYEQVLHQNKFFWQIPRPKKPVQLPYFFNQDEIAAIINSIENEKHKTMLMLAYSSGLRVSEVVALQTKNIDSKRMCIKVEAAKGKKDRMVALSPVLLVMLRAYWTAYKPSANSYLFEGQTNGSPYSARSLQMVLQAAKQKAGIIKPGSIHALRHSFATHLLDKGTDVTLIMKLLGHNDLKTTLRYLHVTNRDLLQIISPLDNLNLTQTK